MDKELIREMNSCRSCGGKGLATFLDFGNQPLANSLLESPEQAEGFFPLEMVFCHQCFMVQLRHTADPGELFSHYVWVTGTSSTAKNQAYRFRDAALERLEGSTLKTYVLEIASNDGTYLRPFKEKGFNVFGVDPAANIVKIANVDGISTQCGFFSETLAQQIVEKKGRPDLVIARNVLAHVAHPHDFVKGIAHLVGETSMAAIEFHYGAKILDGLQYDSIYHEHLCYITTQTIINLLALNGLTVVDIDEGPISGGALIVYVRKEGTKPNAEVARYLEREKVGRVNDFETWCRFGKDVMRHRDALLGLLDEELKAGRRVVGYGASARSSTMLNFCGIASDRLPVIADQNPLKHNKFTAGTHIPIMPPKEVINGKPDTILILSWNFLNEIKRDLVEKFGFTGRIIVPLPSAPVIESIK